jgi:serine protease Do
MSLKAMTPELASRYQLDESRGLVVVQVERGSPAAEAGIRRGDDILEVDQKPVDSVAEFNRKMRGFKEGDTVLMLVSRRGQTLYRTLRVA